MKEIKRSNVTIEDIMKYSGVGGYKGKVYSEVEEDVVAISDYEQCLGLFLLDLENRITGESDGQVRLDPKILKGMTKKDIARYFQGKVDETIDAYMEIYGINRTNLVEKKELIIDTRHMFSLGTGIFTIQHLLRINGYEIDGDGLTKDIKDKLIAGRPSKIKIPIRYMGKRLDEKKLLKVFDVREYEGNSIIAKEIIPRINKSVKR